VALLASALAPDPRALWTDAPRPTLEAWLDPALRVPFASVLLRAQASALRPGDRVVAVQLPGDGGLRAPRDREALRRSLAQAPVGTAVGLELRRAGGPARTAVRVTAQRPRQALAAQWPVLAAGTGFLVLALACLFGGRHPVATPLFAVSACLAAGLLSALDPALPADRGLLGLGGRARLGALAWSLLPAALLHLAARFPVVVPRFRRPSLAAVPYALWALPAALAQLRFGDAAVGHAIERLALAASMLATAVLVAACALPDRRRTPVERVRARAAAAGFAVAGAGPLAVFASGAAPAAPVATVLALASLALPVAFGWAVARYRLLDPPRRVRRGLLSLCSALGALAAAAAALALAGRALGATADRAPALELGLAAAALQPAVRGALERLARGGAPPLAPEALLARAGRELAGATHPERVRERLAALLRDGLGAAQVEVVVDGEPARGALGRRGRAHLEALPGPARGCLLVPPRAEDPDALRPELLLRVEPRAGPAALVVLASRPDGLPYAPEELRAAADVGRLAALALGDAATSAALEERVALRTAALRRALADRNALVAAAERIQAAAEPDEVRAAVSAFLCARAGRTPDAGAPPAGVTASVVAELCRPPVGRERFAVEVALARAAELQPQADAVRALANLALERLHLLEGLKLEVTRQADELARAASGRRHAEFVRRVAHELRKPNEEIQHLAAHLREAAPEAAARILRASHELGRRMDGLLSRRGRRADPRRVDLVRLADEAVRRVALPSTPRRFVVTHTLRRLPLVADPAQLVSLLENLLDNAVRATADGGRIALRTAPLPPDSARRDPWLCIEVEDDGVGVPPDLGAGLFEPGVGRFRGGLGLGLALCRDVVAAHGGSIELESRPGRTLFRVLLPQLGAPGTA
jgi:signal transduction histidine kinase